MFRILDSNLGVTLHDLRTIYTIDDYYDFHEYLDLKAEAEYLAQKGS